MSINSIKRYIENELSVLIGEEIKKLRRVVSMVGVDFGDDIEKVMNDEIQSSSEQAEINKSSKFSLHIHSSWRILKDSEICVGHSDLFNRDIGGFKIYEYNDKSVANVEFTKISRGLNEIFETETIRVIQVEANELGDLKIYMEDNYCLEIFVDAFEDVESWRFFRNDKDSDHIVIFSED